MPSQIGLQLLNQTPKPSNNVEQMLELLHDNEGVVYSLRAEGMSCKVRYIGLEQTGGQVQPRYEFWNMAANGWSNCGQAVLFATLKRYGPYTAEALQ
jgi:hypothetical protein